METSNIIWIAISAVVGALLGRASVPIESAYYIKMSKAIIRANQNLKKDRDAWKDAAEAERKINSELKKKTVALIAKLKTTDKLANDAVISNKANRKLYEDIKAKHLKMFELLVKKQLLSENEFKNIF